MVKLNEQAPTFKATAYADETFKDISLDDYKGKFVVLFFYPADFTFVCPTELEDMAEMYDEIKKEGAEILSVSTDTHFVHKAWHDASVAIKKIKFPMLGDPLHTISEAYDVLRTSEGLADRATIIIDPDQVVKAIEITDEPIGRNAKELLRKIQALKFARENPGLACPAKWNPGDKTLKPGIDLVGKI
ncbi:MAG: redoxin domain-containing protein [Nanoarchaeota archaeon]|nr:redoxin domain-containing protein [Nanoarchaeota archaeon]